jgi:hypothetical protein
MTQTVYIPVSYHSSGSNILKGVVRLAGISRRARHLDWESKMEETLPQNLHVVASNGKLIS